MEQKLKPGKWIITFGVTVIIGLSLEIVFLAIQNHQLKNMLKSMSSLSQMEPLKPGEKVESFKVQTLDGNTNELMYNEPSKKYLLFVLSTTCPHCEKTLVTWKTIVENNKEGKCNIIGVSIHDLDETKKYVNTKNVGFYIVSAADTSFSRKYKISGVPETILINGEGVVEKTWIGELNQDQTNEIQNLISTSKALTN